MQRKVCHNCQKRQPEGACRKTCPEWQKEQLLYEEDMKKRIAFSRGQYYSHNASKCIEKRLKGH